MNFQICFFLVILALTKLEANTPCRNNLKNCIPYMLLLGKGNCNGHQQDVLDCMEGAKVYCNNETIYYETMRHDFWNFCNYKNYEKRICYKSILLNTHKCFEKVRTKLPHLELREYFSNYLMKFMPITYVFNFLGDLKSDDVILACCAGYALDDCLSTHSSCEKEVLKIYKHFWLSYTSYKYVLHCLPYEYYNLKNCSDIKLTKSRIKSCAVPHRNLAMPILLIIVIYLCK